MVIDLLLASDCIVNDLVKVFTNLVKLARKLVKGLFCHRFHFLVIFGHRLLDELVLFLCLEKSNWHHDCLIAELELDLRLKS